MAALNQRPITEQIEQLKSKIDLLEGDRKAYKQTAEWSVKKNDEKIGKLRKENKDLRKQLADRLAADDHVIGKALEDHPDERKMLTNKTGADAVTLIDYRLCDTMKRLNAYESTSRDKESRLEQLEARYEALIADHEAAEATDVGESPEGQRLRSLENRFDKAQLKCTEAEHIKQTYEQVSCLFL
jgi:outer membrane murein-binding lipoprotein Lpp